MSDTTGKIPRKTQLSWAGAYLEAPHGIQPECHSRGRPNLSVFPVDIIVGLIGRSQA